MTHTSAAVVSIEEAEKKCARDTIRGRQQQQQQVRRRRCATPAEHRAELSGRRSAPRRRDRHLHRSSRRSEPLLAGGAPTFFAQSSMTNLSAPALAAFLRWRTCCLDLAAESWGPAASAPFLSAASLVLASAASRSFFHASKFARSQHARANKSSWSSSVSASHAAAPPRYRSIEICCSSSVNATPRAFLRSIDAYTYMSFAYVYGSAASRAMGTSARVGLRNSPGTSRSATISAMISSSFFFSSRCVSFFLPPGCFALSLTTSLSRSSARRRSSSDSGVPPPVSGSFLMAAFWSMAQYCVYLDIWIAGCSAEANSRRSTNTVSSDDLGAYANSRYDP
mmetsp:Transcript_7835/g.32398  ORF Transcript_7835/g.32398 Transcript_7835/m.32398 type:complete len:338 (+) Transcript_7835:211-1224(+)